jgi:hypothetical protein
MYGNVHKKTFYYSRPFVIRPPTFSMKKRPYKRGDLYWRQFNSIYFYLSESEMLPDKRDGLIRRGPIYKTVVILIENNTY